jgi:hypothetical protein
MRSMMRRATFTRPWVSGICAVSAEDNAVYSFKEKPTPMAGRCS